MAKRKDDGPWKDGLCIRGKVWHYRFSVGGVAFTGSTGTLNKTDARAIRDEARLSARQEYRAKGELSKQRTRRGHKLTIFELGLAWIEAHLPPIRKASHVEKAKHNLRVMKPIHDVLVEEFSKARFAQWTTEQVRAGRGAGSINQLQRYLLSWIRWGFDLDMCKTDPKLLLKMKTPMKVQEKILPCLQPEQVPAFLAWIDENALRDRDGARARVFVRVLIGLGLRISEATGMRWENFVRGPVWTYYPAGKPNTGTTKNSRTRRLEVPEPLRLELESIGNQADGLVFPSWGTKGRDNPTGTGEPTRHLCRSIIRRAGQAIGVKGLSHHGLRRTFGGLFLRGGGNMEALQQAYGHSDIKVTKGYVRAYNLTESETIHRIGDLMTGASCAKSEQSEDAD